MKTLLLLLLLATAGSAGAQAFRKEMLGHWKGTLTWYPAGKKPTTVPMQLIVRATDTAGVYTWQIIYGAGGKDNRPYLLRAADSSGTHWIVDERDGILIDQYWIGGRFTSTFSVQNSTIHDAYWIEGGRLIAEFYNTGVNPVRSSGAGTNDVPEVKSYPTRSYQRAVLRRVKG